MQIKQIIVVEGKNDTNVLKSHFECDTIETSGTHLSQSVLETLKEIHRSRGIIVFTDPDYPGEYIRKRINEAIPNVKNAFIQKEVARTDKKVGVEHASKEELEKSLKHVFTYEANPQESLTYKEYIELGFVGMEDSADLREKVGNLLFVGKCNAKTLYKRINMLGLNKEQIKKVIEDLYE